MTRHIVAGGSFSQNSANFLSNLLQLSPFMSELTHYDYEIARESGIRPNISSPAVQAARYNPQTSPGLRLVWP